MQFGVSRAEDYCDGSQPLNCVKGNKNIKKLHMFNFTWLLYFIISSAKSKPIVKSRVFLPLIYGISCNTFFTFISTPQERESSQVAGSQILSINQLRLTLKIIFIKKIQWARRSCSRQVHSSFGKSTVLTSLPSQNRANVRD